jgi:hypothetical protein
MSTQQFFINIIFNDLEWLEIKWLWLRARYMERPRITGIFTLKCSLPVPQAWNRCCGTWREWWWAGRNQVQTGLDIGGYVPYLCPKLEINVVGLEERGGEQGQVQSGLDIGGYVPYLFPKLEINVVGLEESGG